MIRLEIIPESIQLLKITDEEYFSEKYKDYVSNSKLSLINPEEGGSIEKFNLGFKSDYSDSFELGGAVHSVLLQPEYYEVSNITKPSSKLGFFCDKLYELQSEGIELEKAIPIASERANYYSGKLSEKRKATALTAYLPYYQERSNFEKNNILDKTQIYLSHTIKDKYDRCISELTSNRQLMNKLNPSSLLNDVEIYNEYAILAEIKVIYEDEEVIVKVKGKLDNFTIDHEIKEVTLNDLKTSGKYVKYFMGNKVNTVDEDGNESEMFYNGSFQKFHYYRQMAKYLFLLSAYCQSKGLNYTPKANMLVVETIPDFKSKVFPVNNKQIKIGLEEFKQLLILVANEQRKG